MTTTAQRIPQAEVDAVAFDLPYYGGFATWTIRAFMVRNHNRNADDTFSVYAADESRRFLGYGDTKDEAVSDAQMELAPEAEQAAFDAGRIDRPYGKLVRS